MAEKRNFVVDQSLMLPTTMTPPELTQILKDLRPLGGWRHLVHFSNGMKTSDIERASPWSDAPLNKLMMVEREVPEFARRGGRALDIGCNIGYNSLYLAHVYEMDVVGIEVSTSHIEVCRKFSEFAGLDNTTFLLENAETYLEPNSFDLLVHFGTLYHLRNPIRALEAASKNLKIGGILALETQCHGERGGRIARYVRGFNNDSSNWWALGDEALLDIVRFCGFGVPKEVFHWTSPLLDGMYRIIWVLTKEREVENAYDDERYE